MKLIVISSLVLFVLLFAEPYSHAFAESKDITKLDVKTIMTTYKFAVEKGFSDPVILFVPYKDMVQIY